MSSVIGYSFQFLIRMEFPLDQNTFIFMTYFRIISSYLKVFVFPNYVENY